MYVKDTPFSKMLKRQYFIILHFKKVVAISDFVITSTHKQTANIARNGTLHIIW